VKKPDDSKVKNRYYDVRYYCLLPEVDLEELLDRAFANENQSNKDFKDLWTQLKTDHRITNWPCVTIVHKKANDKDLWDRCTGLHEMSTPPLFKCTLRNLVWDGYVMANTVEDFDVVEAVEGSPGGSKNNELGLPDETRSMLHVSVGTHGSEDDGRAVEDRRRIG
jgi:tRNA ligase